MRNMDASTKHLFWMKVKRILAGAAMVGFIQMLPEVFSSLSFDFEYGYVGTSYFFHDLLCLFALIAGFGIMMEYIVDMSHKIQIEKEVMNDEQYNAQQDALEALAKKTKKQKKGTPVKPSEKSIDEMDADELRELLQRSSRAGESSRMTK